MHTPQRVLCSLLNIYASGGDGGPAWREILVGEKIWESLQSKISWNFFLQIAESPRNHTAYNIYSILAKKHGGKFG